MISQLNTFCCIQPLHICTFRFLYNEIELSLYCIFRSAFELWGQGRTHSELKTSLLNYPSEKMVCGAHCFYFGGRGYLYTFTINSDVFQFLSIFSVVSPKSPFLQKDSTYRINVYTFNKTLEFADRIQRIDVSIRLLVTEH